MAHGASHDGADRRIEPRLRVVYLVAIAFAVFLVRDARVIAALAVAHAAAWIALGEGARALARQLVKLGAFAAFVVASYGLTSEEPGVDRWTALDLGVARLPVNVGGALVGLVMVARVATVVLASRVARSGDARAIAEGLRRLGAPAVIASSMDAVLALLGDGARGGGGGGGGGGGRGRHRVEGPSEGFLAGVRRLARGDVGFLVDRIERQIGRAEGYVEHASAEAGRAPDGGRRARDVAVIAGLSLTMLGIKALKLLPSIPFAPGHKLVILSPLYVVAALKTRSRLGATLTGLVMGSVAFLMGDGRYGVFEILKHVAPGVVCDLLVPALTRDRRSPGTLAWTMLGGLMGFGRFATIFAVTFAVQAPAVAWAFLVPGALIHTTFGVLSGLVSASLVERVRQREDEDAYHAEAEPTPTSEPRQLAPVENERS